MAKKKWGVVPYRMRNGFVEVLLITTHNDNWALPKGNLVKKLGAKRTALLEAYEEAGVLGSLTGQGKVFGKGRARTIHFYPMEVEEELKIWPEKNKRLRRWVSPSEAQRILKHKKHRKAVTKLTAYTQLNLRKVRPERGILNVQIPALSNAHVA